MDSVLAFLSEQVNRLHLPSVLKASIYLGLGYVAGKALAFSLRYWLKDVMSAHNTRLIGRISFYLVFGVFSMSAMWELGFSLELVLGAAGIFTVAIGFASQTSASNLISGLFLLSEGPFQIGDTIRIGETLGEVMSIDLLSVKIRTFDNLFVRIPNETVIKSEITTLTKYKIRRMDIELGVAYKEDLENVRDILFELADKDPKCLDNPKPLFFFNAFGSSALEIQFSVWTLQEGFFRNKTEFMMQIKKAFDENGIEIPFPHVTVYTGSKTDPMPLAMVKAEQKAKLDRGS